MTELPEPATMRAFIALAPTDPAKTELEHALRPAYAAYPHLRWNRIEDWHITLAFLGELPVRSVQRLRAPLADLAASHPSPELGLRGGGHFDARVLWSGVAGDLDGLRRLAREVRARVADCEIAVPQRPLRPHLTLARARRYDTTSVTEAAAGLDGFTGHRWRSVRLHLVGSSVEDGTGIRRYADTDAWVLAGAD
ncbi:RNA 2',3'-cyclic phosphodiesterase [Streptomyces sp. Q6]|uniref:RNA 2',3'-cyclic phosphodiesterase n=1 Tax=Streptomyces citrinus TaxID=3118173 RepID=A0ACD5AMY2_9ACTN